MKEFDSIGRQIALASHCRYCDQNGDTRAKCNSDIEADAKSIAEALRQAHNEAIDLVYFMTCPSAPSEGILALKVKP